MRLALSQREEPKGLKHVTRITKATEEEYLDERRICLTVRKGGRIWAFCFGRPICLHPPFVTTNEIVSVEAQNEVYGFNLSASLTTLSGTAGPV